MLFIKLALRNLARHRNRTFVTSTIIALAIFLFILMDSLIGGMTDMSYATLIDYEFGHLQIVNRSYWHEKEKLPLKNLLPWETVNHPAVRNISGLKGVSPELEFLGRLNNGINELPVVGKGIIPNDFYKVYPLADQFVEGAEFALGEHKAVLGKRLAELLKLDIGDYITILVKDKNETFNTIDAEVAGLVHTINPNVNSNYVYLPLDVVQQALAVDESISRLIIRLDEKDLAHKASRDLQGEFSQNNDQIGVYPWHEIEAVSVADAKNAGIRVMLGVILLIAAIAIINNVILAALERMPEIGMMKAMGLEEKEIVYVFVTEATGIGVLGGFSGVILGALGVGVFRRVGVDFTTMMDLDMAQWGIPVLGKIYGSWSPITLVQGFIFAASASFLASILPAYWAARKDPIQAIYRR
ncbi:MAG: ABC transporter permease [Firmicutes bacterium]|nr:ABC transporter permease [Bacillota bacterium]